MTNYFFDRNSIPTWNYVFNLGVTRLPIDGLYYIDNEFNDQFLYNQNKNYQFITSVTGSSISSLSIKFSAPFKSGVASETRDIDTTSGVLFYTYANPISTELSKNIIRYGAPETFTASYITKSTMREIDFLINGYREFRYLNLPLNHRLQPNGWCYEVTNNIGSYNWYFSSTSSVISPSYSVFGSGLEEVSPRNNYIASLIDYDFFNLDFDFLTIGGSSNDMIEMYLVNQNDLKFGKTASWGNPIHSLTASGSFSDVNLSATNIDGTKKYLVFIPSMVGPRTYPYVGRLSNIKIVGGYNPINNLQVVPVSDLHVEIDNSVYTYQSVTNGVTYSLSSKIGNGYFRAGIWENGVWNNGWRDDTEVRDFDDVYSSVLYAYDISWKIKISGSTYSCKSFKVGDKVAIGNIVAIDINENRKLIRDYYTITDIDTDLTWIEVSLDTTFPYRRIEKDSPNHKIKVTKNVWLSGGFFNGYFSGVWNNGLFKGYPKITEMFNTHWIDGFFNGGHFNSNYPEFNFTDIKATDNCQYNNTTLVFGNGHGLLPGDYIIIEKGLIVINNTPTLLNAGYNGITRVLAVNGNDVTIDKQFLEAIISNGTKVLEPGKVTRYTATAVIQNFKFYDTNRSKLKSNESSISSSIFSFNSWIDTNYDVTRSVSIGRDFKTYEPLTGKSVSRNNLYGYPTYDVLSSASRFRNSFDLNYGLYKLGTKYKLFTDFIGDAASFNEPFDPALPNISNFYNAGWTFSYRNSGLNDTLGQHLKFNRSEAIISTNNASNNVSLFSPTIQNYIDSGVTGNELYITATNSGAVLNNNNVNVSKSRYSVVEFDVVTYSVSNNSFKQTNQQPYDIITTISEPLSVVATQSILSNTIITSTYSQSLSILANDLINLAVEINLDCTGSDLGNIIINLISPANKIINLKNSNGFINNPISLTSQTRFTNTIFDFSSTRLLSTGNQPYSGTFSMEKQLGIGATGYSSNSTNISDLFTNEYTNTQGIWTIYIQNNQNNTNVYPTLGNWKLITTYKNYIDDPSINITPIVDIPILHLNNLNYEIASQPLGNGQSLPIYKRMSYLPIAQNINHLTVQNSFRFDSIEKTSADRYNGFGTNTIKKKYEYFYNKTDLMMTIQGNGDMGASQSMLVLDNIKMYETDMIPFFKYFEDANIYKGIQVPYEGVAPNIDYLNSDFVFIDNITIGLDSINNTEIGNLACLPSSINIITASFSVVTNVPTNVGTASATINGNVTIQGNIILSSCGFYLSTSTTPSTSQSNIVYTQTNSGSLVRNLTDLIPNTTYYYQTYAITQETTTSGQSLGLTTTFGDVLSFTTIALPPDYSGDYSVDYSH